MAHSNCIFAINSFQLQILYSNMKTIKSLLCFTHRLPNVLLTPHIAGSTEEAQEIVGVRIAEQLAEYLRSGVW